MKLTWKTAQKRWGMADKEKDDHVELGGVTLRDLFAMAVLAGCYARASMLEERDEVVAHLAYKQADAMLKVRKR